MPPPPDLNLLELYRAHGAEIEALADPATLFLLAYTNQSSGMSVDQLAVEVGLGRGPLRVKVAQLLRAQLVAEDNGRLGVTPYGRRVLGEIGFAPPAPPTQPPPKPLPGEPAPRGRLPKAWITGVIVIAALVTASVLYSSGTVEIWFRSLSASPAPTPTAVQASLPASTETQTVTSIPAASQTPTAGPTGTPTSTSTPLSTPTSTPIPFSVTGVEARVSPSSASNCPATFTFTGVISVNTAGTLRYRWVRSDSSVSLIQTLTFVRQGSKVVSDAWALSQSYSGWELVQILSPKVLSSRRAAFTLRCQVVQVTNVTASVSSPKYYGSCPTTLYVSGVITAMGTGTVTYHWEGNDGTIGADASLYFEGSGSQTVTLSLPETESHSGWERLVVTSPNSMTSNEAFFYVECVPPTLVPTPTQVIF